MPLGAEIIRSLKVGHVSKFLKRSSEILSRKIFQSLTLPHPDLFFFLPCPTIVYIYFQIFFLHSHPHTSSINMESTKVDKDFHLSDLSILYPEKLQQLDNILKILLNSSVAQDTFAQIIDGRPPWQSQPSQEARQKYNEFRASFSAQALKLDTQVH